MEPEARGIVAKLEGKHAGQASSEQALERLRVDGRGGGPEWQTSGGPTTSTT